MILYKDTDPYCHKDIDLFFIDQYPYDSMQPAGCFVKYHANIYYF